MNEIELSRGSDVTRRRFVQGGIAAAAAVAVGAAPSDLRGGLAKDEEKNDGKDSREIPKAVLGKTGEKVSILGLGTACLGHQNRNKPEVSKLIDVFSEAIDRGIHYVDTARIYGRAEEALAEVLKTRRDKVFLVSKVWAESASDVAKSFEATLKHLKQDSLDLLHLHSCGSQDIDKVLADDGAWKKMRQLQKEGKVRFLGLSGHSRPTNFVRMIEETKAVDVIMVAMNFVDYHVYGFEEKVLPVARKHEVGVMAMKVFGGIQGGFKNYSSKNPFPSQMEAEFHRDSIRYAKGLEGVTGMVIGVHSEEQLRRNIELVLETEPMSKKEIAALRERGKQYADGWGPRFGPVA